MPVTTESFIVNQLPQFTTDGSGNILSVVLKAGPIFQHMNQITVQPSANNGSDPTSGRLFKNAFTGLINATSSEFTAVCNGVEGMQSGDTRTLQITGNEDNLKDDVTSVAIAPHAAALRPSDFRGLLGTGTGTEG